MEIGAGSAVVNSLITASYYGHKSGCFQAFKRRIKKTFLKNVKAIVIPDNFKTKINDNLITMNEDVKILDIEKVYQLTFNKELLSSIKKLKLNDIDTYTALSIKSMRDLLMRYRLNNNTRCVLFVLCSNLKMAQQLGIKNSNIEILCPSDKCMKEEMQDLKSPEARHYIKDINDKNKFKNKVRFFDNLNSLFEQVKNLIDDESVRVRELSDDEFEPVSKDKAIDSENIEIEEESKER
jgi:hypothetical protein